MKQHELTQKSIFKLFQDQLDQGNVQRYIKTSKILWRLAIPGETIITTCGGKIETINTIKDDFDRVIVMNIQIGSSAEQYIIGKEKFSSRYTLCDEIYNINGQRWELAKANGEVDGFCYTEENSITFMAPWDEEMLLTQDDMLVRCVGSEIDIYRIAREEFDLTYEKKNI